MGYAWFGRIVSDNLHLFCCNRFLYGIKGGTVNHVRGLWDKPLSSELIFFPKFFSYFRYVSEISEPSVRGMMSTIALMSVFKK